MMPAHSIREGMRVRTVDGSRLGRVVLTGERTFQVVKGFFFPREYVARYDDVKDVAGGDVVLAVSREELARGAPAGAAQPGERPLYVERESYRVGADAPVPGSPRVQHKEFAVGYSEAVGELITFHSERTWDEASHQRQAVRADKARDDEPGERP